ncbi:hypothetical protein [Candidatus Nitrospira allomarina]|uniref:Uncharacterized protein n=1 Tax=Candidatus Nitrospira allomarina TaxID=3020900 RepID=A0AA96JXI3_9BACT|nr:hypothetical protein [Candidatus Nitrospira allomarina]WNM59026.1 hypothetical protein PP769_04465 [Candidatus Nitrospira allomarina]
MSDSLKGSSMPESQVAVGRQEQAFLHALEALEQATPFVKAKYQPEVIRRATDLFETDEGLQFVRGQAHRFDSAGVFHAGPWEHPDRLLPELVGGGLRAEGQYPSLEMLSELRVLSIAAGESPHPKFSAEQALAFLRTVMGLNLELLYGSETEESRLRPNVYARARRLLARIEQEISSEGLLEQVLDDIDARVAQRPIDVSLTLKMIEQAKNIQGDPDPKLAARLERYLKATGPPTPLAKKAGSPTNYRNLLANATGHEIENEAKVVGKLLTLTGLSSEYHVAFLQHALKNDETGILAIALDLTEVGQAHMEQYREKVLEWMRLTIHPATSWIIYGFQQMLERMLLARPEVSDGLSKLINLDLCSSAQQVTKKHLPRGTGITANAAIVGGAIAMLGQPLGVGQGNNPTCQGARALSLWSLHDPGYLLQLLTSAARDDTVEFLFEGSPIFSKDIGGGVAEGKFDLKLDPVSRILVPHLDRIYDEMMRRAALRGEDPHKWVNPALYGRWVPNSLTSINLVNQTVSGYENFLRLFYATHHPLYDGGHDLVYPNPVGLLITNVHGVFLGYHAVSIQRVAEDEEGKVRVYFFNPNNEGRQNWGKGVEPSVVGHLEIPGESSLPFEHFAAHIYAFHYNQMEVGDLQAVPTEIINEGITHAKESWGQAFTWL